MSFTIQLPVRIIRRGDERADFDTLLTSSDIISVHAPLDANTQDLMNAEAFAKMKKSAIFLNLGRGPIVVEQDLADALKTMRSQRQDWMCYVSSR